MINLDGNLTTDNRPYTGAWENVYRKSSDKKFINLTRKKHITNYDQNKNITIKKKRRQKENRRGKINRVGSFEFEF